MKPFTFAVLADSHIRIVEKGDGYDFYPSNQFANARSQYIVQSIWMSQSLPGRNLSIM